MRQNRLSVLVSALALGSCGGGGGSDTPISVVPGPTPAPVPTPTATPTPPPTFTYSNFDLTHDRVFAGQVATASTLERYTSDSAPFYTVESQQASLQTNREELEFAFGADRSLVIRFGGEVVNFFAADVQNSTTDAVIWKRVRSATMRGDAATLSRLPNVQYIYNGFQAIDEDVREPNTASAFRETTRYLLIGERTLEGDAPTAGTSSYSVMLNTTAVGRNRGGGFAVTNGVLMIDHASGAVSARLTAYQESYVTGTTPETATLVLAGMLTSSGISGTISSPDSGYTGVFNGDIFGPRAIETGLVLTLSRADGVQVAGRIFGHR